MNRKLFIELQALSFMSISVSVSFEI